MNQTQPLVLLYVFAIATRIPRLLERWPAPLVRGPEWFFGASVPPDFLAGPGRAILRRYRLLLSIPWAIEVLLLAAILLAGRPNAIPWLLVGIGLFTRANYYAVRQWAENQARRFENPAPIRQGSMLALSLEPRRLGSYTNPWVEAVIALTWAGSLIWLSYWYVHLPDRRDAAWLPGAVAVSLYLQAGLLLIKRAIVRARAVVPVENPEQYLVWRDSLRRFSTGRCDFMRLILLVTPVKADVRAATGPQLHGAPLRALIFSFLAVALVTLWYEYRSRREYLEVARRTKPATLIARPDIHQTGKLICFLPSYPALLMRGRDGYALNLASRPARVAGFYLAGFILICSLTSTLRSQPAAPPDAIAGEWNGTIAGKLRVIVRIQTTPDRTWTGVLESPDQGNAKLEIERISYDGGRAIHLELQKISASYDAELAPNSSEMTGVWQQGGARIPLTLRRPGAAPASALKPVTRGRIPLHPCPAIDGGTQALCGTFPVYENRATRAGRKIALNLMLLPALAEKPAADPVFAFAGGPGQGAVEAYPLATYIALLRKQRDIVLIDQRGTGQSNPLGCAVDPHDPQSLINGPASVDSLPACRAELERIADLTQYTTSNSVDDADDIREALGFEQINVLGGSYGSQVSLVYLRRHPTHVRAVLVEGVVPPDYRLPLPFAKTIQASLNHLFEDCAIDPACRQRFPTAKQDFDAVVKRLDREPAKFEFENVTISLTRGAFVSDLRALLYQPGAVSRLPWILRRAYEKDWTPFATAAIATRRAVSSQVARGMSFSVTCAESIPLIAESDILRETAGTALGDFDVRTYQRNCRQWPHATVPADFLAPVRSDVPVLLISGAEDPATPPSFAEHAAKSLTHSRVVTIPKGTHLTASACLDKIIAQFIDTASTAAVDTACVAQIRNPDFVTVP
jgi:pimeloyl-ACP methyl ester carboxylesterase